MVIPNNRTHARGREGGLAPAPIDKGQEQQRRQATLPDHEPESRPVIFRVLFETG